MKNSPMVAMNTSGTSFSTVVTIWKPPRFRTPEMLMIAGSQSPTVAIAIEPPAIHRQHDQVAGRNPLDRAAVPAIHARSTPQGQRGRQSRRTARHGPEDLSLSYETAPDGGICEVIE